MPKHFQSEFVRILLISAGCLGLGLMVGLPLTGLLTGLIGYICWTLYQIHLLNQWMEDPEDRDPPNLQGIFEFVLDGLLRVSRQHSRERQLLRATLNRQNRLISGVRDAVLLISEDNRVTWFNEQAAELLNLQDNEDIGIPLGNLMRDPGFFSYVEGGNFSEPTLLPAPGNRTAWVEVAVTEYEHGDKILVLRDVTRMQRLEQMRSDFIANLSHELRTPLTVLRGYIETLFLQPNLPNSTMKIYEEMDNQSARMAQLLTDLATLSKLESKDASRTPTAVDVSALLHRIINDAYQLSNYDDHVFTADIEPNLCLIAVENELYSAFSNLVFNAVRHTPEETKIQVKAKAGEKTVLIEIKDNGPGIETKHLPRITERFYRADISRNSGTGGTGLGLAIVKHAINAQNGQLDIQSTLGKGACFSCRFPISQLCESENISI